MPDHTTGQNAPLNNETFKSGFTIEAFVNIPLGWDSGDNSWMSVLSRRGEAGQAGKTGQNTDQNEPERQPWRSPRPERAGAAHPVVLHHRRRERPRSRKKRNRDADS